MAAVGLCALWFRRPMPDVSCKLLCCPTVAQVTKETALRQHAYLLFYIKVRSRHTRHCTPPLCLYLT